MSLLASIKAAKVERDKVESNSLKNKIFVKWPKVRIITGSLFDHITMLRCAFGFLQLETKVVAITLLFYFFFFAHYDRRMRCRLGNDESGGKYLSRQQNYLGSIISPVPFIIIS